MHISMGENHRSKVLPLVLFFSLVAVAFVNVESSSSSSSSSSSPSNITVGSSISTSPNQSSFWLSPSTNFAFGFYPVSSEYHLHVIGIWLTRSNARTLVWTANPDDDDSPFSDTNSSLVLDRGGAFMVQSSGKKAKPLFSGNNSQSAWYASMQDNGNFVIYASDSSVIWQSFEHPTDTILAGQVLRPGQILVSNDPSKRYKLSMQEDGDIVISDVHDGRRMWSSKTGDVHDGRRMWSSKTGKEKSNAAALSLDTNGRLYLADSGIIRNFTNGDDESMNGSSLVYRATLDSNGSFSLYKEMIGLESQESVVIWNTSSDDQSYGDKWKVLVFAAIVILTLFCVCKLNDIRKFYTRKFNVDTLNGS